jgi:hypothetical protein
MFWRCCWVEKSIKHELEFILMKGETYSKQNHHLDWGKGGEVSNITGYRAGDSWRSGENGNIPPKWLL